MKIPLSWQNNITSVVSKYNIYQPESGFIEYTPQHFLTCNPNDVDTYFCPSVYIWDPISPSLKFKPIFCMDHMCSLTPSNKWMDGSTTSRCPRICLDVRGPVLLVGQDFNCELQDHRIRSTDIRLLEQCSRFSKNILFTHKSACTIDFLTYVLKLVADGLSFDKILDLYEEIVRNNFFMSKANYIADCENSICEIQYERLNELDLLLKDMMPSKRALEDLFISWFGKMENGIRYEMASVKAKAIMIDHTFKMSTGVGGFRTGDDKTWVKLFGSLFIAMNENKEIIGWQFTSTDRFAFVETCLTELFDKNQIEMIILDNCCKWENKVHNRLSKKVGLKLDPFHGIQRLILSIKKTHPYHRNLCKDLRNILRQVSDMRGSRDLETDTPDNILKNIDMVISKWKSIDPLIDGVSLITNEMQQAIDNLKKHIVKGCLSNIPSGCSTGMNENLHKNLNKLYKGHCMGPQLANAIISFFFCIWNRKRQKSESSLLSLIDNEYYVKETFGFRKNDKQLDGKWITKSSEVVKCPITSIFYLYKSFINLNVEVEMRLFCRDDLTQLLIENNSLSNDICNIERFGLRSQVVLSLCSNDFENLFTSLSFAASDFFTENIKYKSIERKFLSVGISDSLRKNYDVLSSLQKNNTIETLKVVSNYLGITIVLITNSFSIPVVPIYTDVPICNQVWLFLHRSNSQFQPIVQTDIVKPVVNIPSKKMKLSCNCGRKKSSKSSCCPSNEYTTRCPCYKSGQGCSACNCKSCKNPFGESSEYVSVVKSRVRQATQLKSNRISSLQFLAQKEEVPVKGPWSIIESMVLIYFFEKYKYEFDESFDKFNTVAKYLMSKGFQINVKSKKEIQSKTVYEKPTKDYFEGLIEAILFQF